MANTVKLVIAGDSHGAEDAFNRVGDSAKKMGGKADEASDSFSRVGERADDVDTKAMGFRDTLTGIQDTTKGLKSVASGDWGFTALLTLGAGIGDLGSGMFNFLVPAFKATTTAIKGMNLAFLSSPITWIIIAVVALIAVIVLIATKTDWFQRAWRASWKFIKEAAGAAWDWIRSKSLSVWHFLEAIPGNLRSAFGRVASFLTAPFRAAFNGIARLWNNTIGRLSWSVPGWVPIIGGNSISVPHLPTFHAGGIIPGVRGEAVPFLGLAGERVSGPGSSAGGGRDDWVAVRGDAVIDTLVKLIANQVDSKGGRAAQLGIRFS